MKTLLILISCLTTTFTFSQVNPFGIYVDIDGKVKLWQGEANFNGNLDDTVKVDCGNGSYLWDLRNVKYSAFTFLEAMDQTWTSPNNLDPSQIYETDKNSYIPLYDISIESPMLANHSEYSTMESSIESKTKYTDEIRGLNLTEENRAIVKQRLKDHVFTYYSSYEPEEAYEELYQEFSEYDTIINNEVIYDYVVDHVVFYNYENKNLTSVMGYYWDGGIEYDSLRYNTQGDITFFSRESIGILRDEFHFEYNEKGQLTYVLCNEAGYLEDAIDGVVSDYIVTEIKFEYSPNGLINARLELLEDGTWETCRFEYKVPLYLNLK